MDVTSTARPTRHAIRTHPAAITTLVYCSVMARSVRLVRKWRCSGVHTGSGSRDRADGRRPAWPVAVLPGQADGAPLQLTGWPAPRRDKTKVSPIEQRIDGRSAYAFLVAALTAVLSR